MKFGQSGRSVVTKAPNKFCQDGSSVAIKAPNKFGQGGSLITMKATLINQTSHNRMTLLPCCKSKLVCCFS